MSQELVTRRTYFKTGFSLRSLASPDTGENVPDGTPKTATTMPALVIAVNQIALSFIVDRLAIPL
jgi:hypothetical protein